MKKKMMKALRDLNVYIDDDRQKLCDRLHNLELSHKRMEGLLRRTLKFFDMFYDPTSDCFSVYQEVKYLRLKIDQELSYPYFRVNYKTKGGKNV